MTKLDKRLGLVIAAILVPALLPLSGGMVEREEIVVHEGEAFVIEIVEALHPFYDWRLTEYDCEYLEFLGESYRPPEDGIMGITIKVFEFKALRAGITEVKFTYYELGIDGEPIAEIDSREYGVRILPLIGPILPLEFEFNGFTYLQTWGILPEGTAVIEFGETDGLTVYALEGIVHSTPPQLFIQNMIFEFVIYIREDMVGQVIISEDEAIAISMEIDLVAELLENNEDAYCKTEYTESDDGKYWIVNWWTPENLGYPWIIVQIDARTGVVVSALCPR
jgi:hypothetical protein